MPSPVLALSAGTASPHVFQVPQARSRRADLAAVALLTALPFLVFGVPALLGHPVLPGDDLTQNFPLRVLAGQQIRDGNLPLFDPYLWSGTPLLASWNAGAAYPLTWLFAVLPAVAAWTINLSVTWAVAGVGLFFFLRALRLASLPSLLGAFSFAFAGAMSAQVSHFGLVAGLSWVPLQLLSVVRITEATGGRARLIWAAVLAATSGLTILAGEPRAIDDAFVIVVLYAAWRITRLRQGRGGAVAAVSAGLALGVGLGAVQLLPGLAAVASSQRAATSAALFNSGSLPVRWLLLMLVPDLLGGSGSFGQPSFLAGYNLTEVTGYVGVLPLVAAFALLGRLVGGLRRRSPLPDWLIWHLVALVGVLLALGGNTPLGHLLVHLPFFGHQRLQSRNILITDLALAVLLAYWADQPKDARVALDLPPRRRGVWPGREAVFGALPAFAMIAVVGVALAWGAGLLRWLGVNQAAAASAGALKVWLIPYALIGMAAIAFVIVGGRLAARPRARWLGSFIAVDVVVFTLLGVVAVLPGLASRSGDMRGFGTSKPPVASPMRPIARLARHGRFAIYDPNELDSRDLALLGAPDLNAIGGTPSIQGYSSLVDGNYAEVTGAHKATGEGQDVLSVRAIGDGALDQLDTKVLATPAGYLMTKADGTGPVPGPPGTGSRDIAAGHQATWYFGAPLEVSKIELPDSAARRNSAAGDQIGLMTRAGSTTWLPAVAVTASRLAITLPHPMASVAVVDRSGSIAVRLGPPSVVQPGGGVLVADGQLQNALVPPRWAFAGSDGPFAVFADRLAWSPLRLAALPGRSAAGASVRRLAGLVTAPAAAAVRSAHGVSVIRAVAAIPGWSATWQPSHGSAIALAVRRVGLVQAVAVPAGQGVLTWSYSPPGFSSGLALTLVAAVLILLITGIAGTRRPKTEGRERGTEGPEAGILLLLPLPHLPSRRVVASRGIAAEPGEPGV